MSVDVQEIIHRLYPRASETLADPYPLYAVLREQAPVFRQADEQGTWHLTRYHDVAAALRDPRLSASRVPRLSADPSASQLIGHLEQMTDQERERIAFFLRYFRLLMLFQDPPDHARLRGLASKAFTPRTVERLRPRIERLVDDFLSPYLSTGEMDVVPALAVPLPLTAIMELLGIPLTDRVRKRLLLSLNWSTTCVIFLQHARHSRKTI
jgi:cytochrome P450